MKRILFLLIALLITCGATTTTKAQGTGYHGEIYAAGGYGVGNMPINRLQLHTIQGVSIGQCFSLGVGTGVDYYTEDFESEMWMIPLFADIKLYAPTAGSFDPFIMVDVGYSFVSDEKELGGLMLGTGVGFKASIFALSIGYHLQQIGAYGVHINLSSLQLKLGVAF